MWIEEEDILQSIPRAHDAPYISATNAGKARFQEGTRDLLFEAIESWEEEQIYGYASTRLCALIGEAGTGKSTIASQFAKRLEERGRLGASFFFTRGMPDLNSPRKFFATIASQLAQTQPALRLPVIAAAREHLKVAVLQQLEKEFRDLLEEPLSALPASHPPIFIIVDALDECTEEGPELVPTLLRLLLSCAAQPDCPLRVFFTSRPEPNYIHKALTSPYLQSCILTIQIQNFRDSVNDDIELLIRARFSEDARSKRWIESDPSIVPNLLSRADGLFVYAQTSVDFILGDLSSLQERYMAVMSFDEAFGLVPLDKLYRNVLESVFPVQERWPRSQRNLKAVLGYLVAIQVYDHCPVSPDTLERLTGLPAVESVPIFNALRSVIFFERDNPCSPFRIVHATFREFLADSNRCGEEFYVDVAQVHQELVKACVQTLEAFQEEYWPLPQDPTEPRSGHPLVGPDRLQGEHVSHVYYAYASLREHCAMMSPGNTLLYNSRVQSALEDCSQYYTLRISASFRTRRRGFRRARRFAGGVVARGPDYTY